MKKFSIAKIVLLFITVCVVSLGITILISFTLKPNNQLKITNTTQTKENELPVPTTMPFSDLTIPVLRTKNYSSNLGDRTLLNRFPQYTSYLTNYQSEGLKINALLTIPTTPLPDSGFPTIVFVHGYIPPKQYSTTTNYQSFVDALARQGFVVFKIDLRGHSNSEGEASGAYYSADYVIDTLNAIAAVKTLPEVNPNSIGLFGHSMAGNVTARALAVQPTIPAAVIWAGAVYTYTDFQEYGIQDSSYQPPVNSSQRNQRRQELFSLHGQPTATSSFWQQVAPITYLPDYKGNLQLHHAVNDEVVSVEFSRNLIELLKSSPAKLDYQEYQTGGHNLSGATFNQAMQSTVAFFEKHL